MIKIDENALICDLAETYHIYNYRQLPADLVAVFSVGLRENARIKMAMSDQKVSLETLLLASIADRVGILAWQNTEDGHKGRNAPKEFVSILTEEPKEREESIFKSGEDFENARARILKDLEVNNGN
ncbi:hypothetical protein CAC02_09215 [Streptococcus gallolyticus]|uniref:Phage protein n=1 Tax=Streptococcus gallolyticus TaxID=315405 RepID=A0A368UEI1_9STRE|nr:DUF5361 domain-containing protein [Streptococcus gallolyticus]RCW16316.1 hypothetical protein CAC02_09215 [Streptococcus gallolyticus]